MLLEKITIVNWRCFYGEQEIEFASGTDKNVTLIHAENGVGKTSLLNALLWCFYKRNTARFEKPNDIINHQAAREGESKASIAVEFSHDDNLYQAQRFYRSDVPTSQDKVIVTRISVDGSNEHIRTDPNLFLNSVLPSEMAGHFLFDGEHAEALTGKSDTSAISNAIKDILGCSFVVQSISALESIEASYRRKVSSSNTVQKASELENTINKYERAIGKLSVEIKELDENIEIMENDRESIERTLSGFANIKQAQNTKSAAVSTLLREQKYEKSVIAAQQTWASKNAAYCLADSMWQPVSELIQKRDAETKKRTRFNKETILKILDLGECVCGTCITENKNLQKNLNDQLETAETQELERRLSKVSLLCRKLNSFDSNEALEKLRRLSKSQNEHFEAIKKAEITLNEVTTALENTDVEKISSLQKDSSAFYREILNNQQSKGEVGAKLQSAKRTILKLKSQLDFVNLSAGDSKNTARNQRASKLLIDHLQNKLDEEISNARGVINHLVREIIEKTARKNFNVIVDKNFSVKLQNKWGDDVAKSEGENQLLGLAFTAALAKFAKIRKNAKNKFLLPGTEAPLVLDAPFGKLDPVYKHATAEFLPEMASQVVVMVNKEQGSKKVLEILKDKIGFQYALVQHNTGPQNEKSTETLEANGKELEITSYDSTFDGTAIEVI